MTPTAQTPFLDQAIVVVEDAVTNSLTLGDQILWDLNAQTIFLPTPQGLQIQASYILAVWLKNPLLGQPPLAHIHQIIDPWNLTDARHVAALVNDSLAFLREQRSQILAGVARTNGPTN